MEKDLLTRLRQHSNKIKQEGYCNTCLQPQEDKYYVFCDTWCSNIWIWVKEKNMSDKEVVDLEIYQAWLNDKLTTIDKMSVDDIQARIIEIAKIEFYAKREWTMLHQQYNKLAGKQVPPWLKADRDKLITNPTISVDWEAEPRKKEKKPKQNLVKDLLGIDMAGLADQIKAKKAAPMDMTDVMSKLMGKTPEKKAEIEQAKPTDEAIKAKADALREKIRLAKEKAALNKKEE
jgi:hypothetical protein